MTITLRRRSVAAIAVILSVLVLAGGTALGQVGPFTDVQPSDQHAGNIDAIFLAGVTAGCNQPGDNYCPNNNVTRAQMASFLARIGGLSSSTKKNFPKTNAKSDAQTYCQLAEDMNGTFDPGPCWQTDQRVADATGGHVAVAIGADERPIVAFYDDTAKDLKAAHCNTSECEFVVVTTLHSNGDVGKFPSIMIGQDGLPLISYYDETTADLNVVACENIACTASHIVKIDTGQVFFPTNSFQDVGQFSSIAPGPEGSPMISYYNATAKNLKLAYCTASDCSTSDIRTLHAEGDVGKYSSLTQNREGDAVVSYWDEGNGDLKVLTCATFACPSDTITITTPDADGVAGYTSIAIGGDGNPVVSYRSQVANRLKVAACSDQTCSAATLRTFGGRAVGDGYWSSVAIDTTGKPVISSIISAPSNTPPTEDLVVWECLDTTCSSADDVGRILGGVPVLPAGLAIGVDGEPLVAYFNATLTDVRMHRPRFNPQREVI